MLELAMPEDDGLKTMPVGPWARSKHHFLRRYIDAFTIAMKRKWPALHYLDLFAGPGLLRIEGTGELEWGSPLIAAQCRLFDGIHLCDLDAQSIEALEARVKRFRTNVSPRLGDANHVVHEFLREIPDEALSLAFLDPPGLQLRFETVRVLSQKRVDLVLFFPDYLDMLRNWQRYRDQPESKLDMFLGDGVDWRSALDQAGEDQRVKVFRDIYVEQVKRLGYTEFEVERISARGRPLYMLMFFSRHPAGAKIWRGISETKPNGQRTMDFGPADPLE